MRHQRAIGRLIRQHITPHMPTHSQPDRQITRALLVPWDALALLIQRRDLRRQVQRLHAPYCDLVFGVHGAAGGLDFGAERDNVVVEGGLEECVEPHAAAYGALDEWEVAGVEDEERVELDVDEWWDGRGGELGGRVESLDECVVVVDVGVRDRGDGVWGLRWLDGEEATHDGVPGGFVEARG